ncbi:2,3-bisphosphoglycerate-independent phosphoglycerate mutase [Myxococcota bacterium]|nr:2,3-bisphosphoglycerate-independent phosphoglycerate mutase [Myxococcota bacterium]MBU1379531.1 2,3-bisphosphoglycerate-independent phosphoglycerate mutase [Myxococcota bacterium]MBU1498965.1 2,3-bisphosphoglycerate-independent phosphoglycerate mutase [Myxococcota bacterium]
MERDKRAVILAAGMGTRLRPITEERPKCLTEVNGKPITWHALKALASCGFEHVTLLLGYRGETVIEEFGNRFGNMTLSYRFNEKFAETNSMYSAWIARDELEKGAWLIEGDILLNETLVRAVARNVQGKSLWLVAPFTPQTDGSMSITDESGRIKEIKIVRQKLDEYRSNYFKSAGILCLMPEYGKLFSRWLDDDVKAGNVNIYYDLVVAKHLEDGEIYAHVPAGDSRWFEIDTPEDLKLAEKIFQPRKYVTVLMDGAADLPIPELNGATPLEVARKPGIDQIAESGTTGLMQTMYPLMPVDSITGNMGILGFYPPRYYPVGRASFEAMAQDIFLDEDDIAFRCNLVSVDGENRISDFTADQIPGNKAVRLISKLKFGHSDIEIFSGQSYRNIMIVRNAPCRASDLVTHPPHQNMGRDIGSLMITGTNPQSQDLAARLNEIMQDSRRQIAELNGEIGSKADMIWFWSPSGYPRMPGFSERFGLRGAIVAGLDFMRGIGNAVGMHTKEIHGATGYLDTAFSEKLKYAKNFLLHNDFVFIHVNAPDEEAHAHHVKGKIEAIEKIDSEIVSPLLEWLEQRFAGNYRIAVLPDHYTCLADSQHLDIPVPFCICGTGIPRDNVTVYNEKEISRSSKKVIISTDFMEKLISDNPDF